jgi:hypothetical protein
MLKTLMGRLPALLALIVLIAFAAPELAAQQVNPTASAVQEEQLLRALQSGQAVPAASPSRMPVPPP